MILRQLYPVGEAAKKETQFAPRSLACVLVVVQEAVAGVSRILYSEVSQ